MTLRPQWSTACLDWRERIVEHRSLVSFEPLFPQEAAAACDIFSSLKIVDAVGRPTFGEASRPWIYDLPRALFGAYDPSSGQRLIQYFFELIAKKNGKSTKAAGIMLTALLRNWRESGEFYILAPTREVADNSFLAARDMVRADEKLRALLHVQENFRTITHRINGAFLKVVAADDQAVGGKKTIGLLVDELWQFGERANADSMLREAEGGLASRDEGFVIYLSTQSNKAPAGVFAQKLKEFRGIRDGTIDNPRSLPILYEFPEAMIESGVYRRPENFYIPNPNLGASVNLKFLTDKRDEDARAGQASLINFEAKHLNVQVGVALGSSPWAGATFWKACGDPDLTLAAILLRSDILTVGIDGGGLDDLLGFGVVGRDRETGDLLHWAHAWAHRSVLAKREQIAPLLLDFEACGDLTLVDKMGDAFTQLADIVEETAEGGRFHQAGIDPAGVGLIVTELGRRGFSEASGHIVGVSQGYRLQGKIKALEGLLSDRKFIHCAQPLMAWCVGNAKVELRGNAILITKQASGVAKIDPVMAMLDATTVMELAPDGGGSIFDREELWASPAPSEA